MPSLASDTVVAELSPSTHRTFIPLSPSRRAVVQVETLSMRSWFSMPSLASDPAVAELSPSTHRRISRRARCALTVLDALLNVGPPLSLSSRRPRRTLVPLLPSCRAIVQVETRSLCSRFSMPFFGVKPPPLLCSRRPHRTFIPLLPSRRVSRGDRQVETRSLRSGTSQCPSLASGRRCCCALAVHIGRLYTALAIVQGDCSSRDALVVRSRYSMPCPTSDGTRHLRSALTSHRWRYSDGLLPS
jgi:hypothetical protein